LLLKQNKYNYKIDNELQNGQNILNNFLEIFNISSIEEIRVIRNKLGSHIDTRDNIEELLLFINNLDTNFLLKIYSDFYNLLYKICDSIFYLKHFMMPPIKINRITAISPQPEKMFFEDKEIQTEFEREDINDEKLYELKFQQLLNSNNNFEEIEYYFREALCHSDIVKNVEFENKNIN